jgi:transcriptional regulator with XRE-family HTH domain
MSVSTKREVIVLDGKKVQKLRLAKVWSQTELAEKLGLSTNAISYIESGRRQSRTQTIRKLIELFGCGFFDIAEIVEEEAS